MSRPRTPVRASQNAAIAARDANTVGHARALAAVLDPTAFKVNRIPYRDPRPLHGSRPKG